VGREDRRGILWKYLEESNYIKIPKLNKSNRSFVGTLFNRNKKKNYKNTLER